MNIIFGSQKFINVQIPLLWGSRAVLQDDKGRISIVSLEGDSPKLEILGDEPASGIRYEIIEEGYKIIDGDIELYTFNPEKHIITGLSINLPECEITDSQIRFGTNTIQSMTFINIGVAVAANERGFSIAGPVPKELAKLTF